MNGILFILLILACPLMMIFMMRGLHNHDAQPVRSDHRVFDETGMLRPGQNLTILRRERDRLESQLDELELEIDTRSGYKDPALLSRGT